MYNKQNKYSNIMIDLETLGVDVDSCILSIGPLNLILIINYYQ